MVEAQCIVLLLHSSIISQSLRSSLLFKAVLKLAVYLLVLMTYPQASIHACKTSSLMVRITGIINSVDITNVPRLMMVDSAIACRADPPSPNKLVLSTKSMTIASTDWIFSQAFALLSTMSVQSHSQPYRVT